MNGNTISLTKPQVLLLSVILDCMCTAKTMNQDGWMNFPLLVDEGEEEVLLTVYQNETASPRERVVLNRIRTDFLRELKKSGLDYNTICKKTKCTYLEH